MSGTRLPQVLNVLYRISRKNQEPAIQIHKQLQYLTFCSKNRGVYLPALRPFAGNSGSERGDMMIVYKKLQYIRRKEDEFFGNLW